MRSFRRKHTQADEEESVFITMTDMTISFLLIVMILLAFFVTLLNDNNSVSQSDHEEVQSELREAQAQNERLSERLSAAQAQNDRLSESLIRQAAERDDYREQLELLKPLKQRLAEATAENLRLSKRLAERTEQRDDYREQLKLLKPLDLYLIDADSELRRILEWLRDGLKAEPEFRDLAVEITPEGDALRFQGEGLFESGESELKPDSRQRAIVVKMGELLDEVLVCHTFGPRAVRDESCDGRSALIDAVQIEGHTDYVNTHKFNLNLSTDRSNETLNVILGEDERILAHRNKRCQPVMSVSGYGKMRPVETNETAEGRAANRRIDLRIIMYHPGNLEDLEAIQRINRCEDSFPVTGESG